MVDSQAEQIETSSTLTFATRPYNMSVSELSVGPNTFIYYRLSQNSILTITMMMMMLMMAKMILENEDDEDEDDDG